ncbi:hypothetical protein ACH4SK_43080 [Streptomyces inhibens]|uniref:hypothetical protein n=1 Tax=Streptomyces inhibens TaxID=2293571 RepID=UPI0037A0F158
MILPGILAKREVARACIRVHTSMTAQARDQGSYLSRRLPYGYRLIDAGPHPNRALARRGVRIQRLAGHTIARITRALADAGIPCPSAADPARNPHRIDQRQHQPGDPQRHPLEHTRRLGRLHRPAHPH